MAEFRTDPLRGHTVLINGQRGNRPSEFTLRIETPDPSLCPFCRGHEHETPAAIEQDRNPDWNWRLFSNRYPAVLERPAPLIENDLTFAAIGRHEVLVETANHFARPHEYDVAKWVDIFLLWQRRLRALYDVLEIKYVHIFRNQGYRGGATLVHPHQQLVGIPFVPEPIQRRLDIAHSEPGCRHCEWLQREAGEGTRILESHGDVVALAAFAPRFPFEWQVMPVEHVGFDELSKEMLERIAGVLRNGLIALKECCGDPDFNLILFSTPISSPGRGLWTLDILPRASTQAGFEWGTGVHIVSTPPEEAARRLREKWPD